MTSTRATSDLAATVGENLRTARKAAGLTQHELAVAVGRIDAARVSAWERGSNRPNDDNLVALARVLGCPIPWFFTDHSTKAAA